MGYEEWSLCFDSELGKIGVQGRGLGRVHRVTIITPEAGGFGGGEEAWFGRVAFACLFVFRRDVDVFIFYFFYFLGSREVLSPGLSEGSRGSWLSQQLASPLACSLTVKGCWE